MCENCRIGGIVLGLIIVIFALWQTAASQWVLAIAGLLILICSVACKHSCEEGVCETPKKPAAKAQKKKK